MSKSKISRRNPKPEASDAEPDTSPVDAQADAEPTVEPTVEPMAEAPDAQADAEPKPDAEPKEEPQKDPIQILRDERFAMEKSVAEITTKIGLAAASANLDAIAELTGELQAARAKVDSVTRAIAEQGFASVMETGVISLFARVPANEIPEGRIVLSITVEDGTLLGVTPVTFGKPGTKRAALKGTSERKTDDSRLPPPGTVLWASHNSTWNENEPPIIKVVMGPNKSVTISGVCKDGTRLVDEYFPSWGNGGMRVLGQVAVNMYRYLGLGSKSHRAKGGWIGEQVAY